MKKTQRRAFILNECKSPYIAQAIFVLKDGVSEHESGVLQDAERIVSSYMGHNTGFKEKKNGKMYFLLSVAILSMISALVITGLYII